MAKNKGGVAGIISPDSNPNKTELGWSAKKEVEAKYSETQIPVARPAKKTDQTINRATKCKSHPASSPTNPKAEEAMSEQLWSPIDTFKEGEKQPRCLTTFTTIASYMNISNRNVVKLFALIVTVRNQDFDNWYQVQYNVCVRSLSHEGSIYDIVACNCFFWSGIC